MCATKCAQDSGVQFPPANRNKDAEPRPWIEVGNDEIKRRSGSKQALMFIGRRSINVKVDSSLVIYSGMRKSSLYVLCEDNTRPEKHRMVPPGS